MAFDDLITITDKIRQILKAHLDYTVEVWSSLPDR